MRDNLFIYKITISNQKFTKEIIFNVIIDNNKL